MRTIGLYLLGVGLLSLPTFAGQNNPTIVDGEDIIYHFFTTEEIFVRDGLNRTIDPVDLPSETTTAEGLFQLITKANSRLEPGPQFPKNERATCEAQAAAINAIANNQKKNAELNFFKKIRQAKTACHPKSLKEKSELTTATKFITQGGSIDLRTGLGVPVVIDPSQVVDPVPFFDGAVCGNKKRVIEEGQLLPEHYVWIALKIKKKKGGDYIGYVRADSMVPIAAIQNQRFSCE